nr:hypothetical protein BaRGS_033980 [Batillaria attramentaria]
MKQLQDVAEAEQMEVMMLRESLTEAQRQQESSLQEKQLLLSQLAEAQKDKTEAMDERDRLKSILEKSYSQEDQLSSRLEVLREENKRLQEELVDSERHRQQLADDNAALAGHANHLQKVSYLKRLQLDYNELKGKYDDVVKENHSLQARFAVSPLRDRTNLSSAASHPDLIDKKSQIV